MKRIGWVGFIEDKPCFEDTCDDYSDLVDDGIPGTPVCNIYKLKTEALKRFEDVREVFIEAKK